MLGFASLFKREAEKMLWTYLLIVLLFTGNGLTSVAVTGARKSY
jgi:hypothetical protein